MDWKGQYHWICSAVVQGTPKSPQKSELYKFHMDSTLLKLALYLALCTKKCLAKQIFFFNGLFSDLCQAKLGFNFKKEQN